MKVVPSGNSLSSTDQTKQKAKPIRVPGALVSTSLPVPLDECNKDGTKSTHAEIDKIEMNSGLKKRKQLYKEKSLAHTIASKFDLISNKMLPDSSIPFTV